MRQWAISVGINQYQCFQPLSYAQHDAQAIHQFLVEAVGIPAEQCLLLTETSPPQWGKSTYPDRQTIQSWLDLLMQRYVQPEDTLWFFFSGYGICQQGQDYLVPIEGDPTTIQATTIPLESIFRSLRQVSAAKVLVLLDVNRNESSFSYETVGNHTVHLASITGIPTILSCQPDEFSRETSALGHGFFTAALLESLRNRQHLTVEALGQYLSQQVPALSEHYWRPIQQPVTICPAEKLQQPLVVSWASTAASSAVYRAIIPQTATANNSSTPTALQPHSSAGNTNGSYGSYANGNSATTTAVAETAKGTSYGSNGGATNGATIAASGENPGAHKVSLPYGGSNGFMHDSTRPANGVNGNSFTSAYTQLDSIRLNGDRANGDRSHVPIDSAAKNHENGVAQSIPAATVPQLNSDHSEDVNEISDALFWQPVLRWGGFLVVGLILGVLLRNCAAFTPRPQSAVPQATNSSTKQTGAGQVPAPATPPGSKTPDTAAIVPIASSAKPAAKMLSPQPIATTQRFGVAGASQLNLPAATGAVAKPQSGQAKAPSSTAQSSVPSHLAKARALAAVNSDQASPYWYAIQEAKLVQPGEPDAAQAKQEIAQWSRQIMSIARQRGRQGGFDAAIIAAHLVPLDQPIAAEAKSAIVRWCPSLHRQRNANPVQRQQAKDTCRSFS